MTTQEKTWCIGFLGEGALYEAVKQRLAHGYSLQVLQRESLAVQVVHCHLVITCHDRWSAAFREDTQALANMHLVPWLPVYCEFDTLSIGPCTRPGLPGCFICAEYRHRCTVKDIDVFLQLRAHMEKEDYTPSHPCVTSWGMQVLLPRVEAEVRSILNQEEEAKTIQAVLCLNLTSLHWTHHHFLPNPCCAGCGNLPEDCAEAAHITLQPRQKLQPTTLRVRALSVMAEQISATYVDAKLGLIYHMQKLSDTMSATTRAHARIECKGSRREDLVGIGRTLNYKQSYLAGLAEALERLGGQFPQGRRTVVRGSFRQLREQALDPVTLGLHTPEQYAQPGYRFVPYHQDLVCNWVWGYSFGQQRAVLIPEFYAYYGFPEKQSFADEISNGCALGSCLEEAILYGLLEVLERDAFLLTWYAQLGVPRLDFSSIPSQRVRWLISHLEYISGYTISLFNTTLLHGAPCCWVMGVDEKQRTDFPRIVCAAGSHVLPEEAIFNALLELAPMLQPKRLQERYQEGRQRALEMLDDPLQVEEMEDHALLYTLPEAFSRLDFLWHTAQQQTFQEAFAHVLHPTPSLDLTEDLSRLLAYYQAQGVDTLVVDQTSPEHQAMGFHCVKVIMPGMLPMTFGQRYRRVSGFKRLQEWPVRAGYRTQPLLDDEINPHPHPFP